MTQSKKRTLLVGIIVLLLIPVVFVAASPTAREEIRSLRACYTLARAGFRSVADDPTQRFLGKVQEFTARCRGSSVVLDNRDTPWVDWSNYWGTADEASRSSFGLPGRLSRSSRGALRLRIVSATSRERSSLQLPRERSRARCRS